MTFNRLVALILIVPMTLGLYGCTAGQEGAPPTINTADNSVDHPSWISQYPRLLQAVKGSPGRTLKTGYQSGPERDQHVDIELYSPPSGGLVARIVMSPGGSAEQSPDGQLHSRSDRVVLIIRDKDEDGLIDDWKMESLTGAAFKPAPSEHVTEDGFISYRNAPTHRIAWIQWDAVIQYCINNL